MIVIGTSTSESSTYICTSKSFLTLLKVRIRNAKRDNCTLHVDALTRMRERVVCRCPTLIDSQLKFRMAVESAQYITTSFVSPN